VEAVPADTQRVMATVEPATGNRLLDALPEDDRKRLVEQGTDVSLEPGQLLFERQKHVASVYFPTSAVASFLIELQDGASVEMATTGREGMVGISRFLGIDEGLARAICQVPGRALRVDADAFEMEVDRSPTLVRLLQGYLHAFMGLMGQTVACNRVHTIERRCARWLLMTRDRIDSSDVPLTQEFLAYMLGVRRQSVTEAAGRLQKSGLISYRRGNITILDRGGLEEAACECYRVIAAGFERLLPLPGTPA
jgi:CRP-like cAMP-binding protein